ncbi:MAG TPA: hypothetical protein VLD18_05710 [Verrucomicrobiae bacterium]|nr:hypothetical protein [Verrucomicrobiae bacterium]
MIEDKGNWKLVTSYELELYPCGLRAGDKLRVKKAIRVRDHRGMETEELYDVGEIWTVLPGVESEPRIIWLRRANGDRCTWDESIFETFAPVTAAIGSKETLEEANRIFGQK